MLQILINAMTLGSIYFLFGVGMSMVWGTIGVLNFTHGAIFTGSAFAAYLLLEQVHVPLAVVLLVGVVTGAVLAIAVHLVAFGPILKREKDRHSGELQIIGAGIGLSSVIVALTQSILNEPFGFHQSSFKVVSYNVGGLVVTNISLVIFALALALGLALALWVRKSIHGVALRSIGIDPRTASLMGINRPAMALALLGIAGGMAGLAGILLTFYLGAIETMSGDHLLIKAFALIVLGGIGSIGGAALGAFVLALSETLLLTYTAGTWVDAVSFGLIFVILALRPHGLFGGKEIRRT